MRRSFLSSLMKWKVAPVIVNVDEHQIFPDSRIIFFCSPRHIRKRSLLFCSFSTLSFRARVRPSAFRLQPAFVRLFVCLLALACVSVFFWLVRSSVHMFVLSFVAPILKYFQTQTCHCQDQFVSPHSCPDESNTERACNVCNVLGTYWRNLHSFCLHFIIQKENQGCSKCNSNLFQVTSQQLVQCGH